MESSRSVPKIGRGFHEKANDTPMIHQPYLYCILVSVDQDFINQPRHKSTIKRLEEKSPVNQSMSDRVVSLWSIRQLPLQCLETDTKKREEADAH